MGISACLCSEPANSWYVPMCCTDICPQLPPSDEAAQLVFINNCLTSCCQAWGKVLRKVTEQMQSFLHSTDVSCPIPGAYWLLQVSYWGISPWPRVVKCAHLYHSLYKIQRQAGMISTAPGGAKGRLPGGAGTGAAPGRCWRTACHLPQRWLVRRPMLGEVSPWWKEPPPLSPVSTLPPW